jgi:hypothetical protein
VRARAKARVSLLAATFAFSACTGERPAHVGAHGAIAPAPRDASTKPIVSIEFRLVRMTESIDPATQRERYTTDIEIVITRPGASDARIRASVPNAGCGVVLRDPIATMQCYLEAHGEYVVIERPRADLLRIRTFGQNEALPGYDPPIEHPHEIATVPIPADAEIEAKDSFEPIGDAGP